MFSYRHSFHAGNHADCIKHIALLAVLEKLKVKAKPAVYIDTHSGGGVYYLDSAEAQKTQEFHTGISKLVQDETRNVHPLIDAYLHLIQSYTDKNQYPGSPIIGFDALREFDAVTLIEYHNNEIETLRDTFAYRQSGPKVGIHHRDGYEGLIAFLPPKPARGCVLIDPPYEHISEYQQVIDTMTKAIRKWATGIYLIWYPLLSERAGAKSQQSERMIEQLSSLPAKSVINISLTVESNTPQSGMYGSGLCIINPPWRFEQDMHSVLKTLSTRLEVAPGEGSFKVEWLKVETE